jgi:type II secretory pathway pseudopilin PulG
VTPSTSANRDLERGETLVELLLAIVILGIAGVAVLGGLGTSIIVSDAHRKQTVSGAAVRAYAEQLQTKVAALGYVSCATAPGSYASAAVGYIAPAGYAASSTGVTYWNLATKTFGTTCGTPDSGVQAVTLQVRDTADTRGTVSLTVVIRKP